MKKHKRFLKSVFVTASVLSNLVQGQAFDQELNFKGSVKTLTLEKQNDSDKKQKLVTIFEYDKNQRKLKEMSPYNSNTDYFYLNKSDTKPTLTKWYGTDNSKETSIEIDEKNKAGQMLLSGNLKSGKWDYYFIHDYTSNLEKIRWFTDGEIYLEKTEEKINLDQFDIPAGFIPFDWDRKLSSGIIKKSKEYTSDRYEHDIVFEYVEKGNPKNRVTFQYHGNDVYDAGKGYWHRFENDKVIEERYIYKASEISDFGHRYIYNTDGKLKSDHYGYFNQLPNKFLQRRLFSYNENGDCSRETTIISGVVLRTNTDFRTAVFI